MSKILIIEDEEKLRNELKTFLNNNGYEVKILEKFDNIIKDILNNDIDMVLLDIKLPNINGEYLLKELRKTSSLPVIMVTSKNTEIDELISINYGADDFITKPYNPEILLARMERILRRNVNNNIKYKDIILDINKSMLIKGDNKIDLSKNELRILFYLLQNKGKIVSREQLIDYSWENDEFIDDNTLTVNISRIKNKLAYLGYKDMIITKRAQGYIIL